MERFLRLFAIEPGDGGPLLRLSPVFLLVGAAAIVVASVAKALFLSAYPLSAVPWVFLGSGALTAVASLGYVQVMQRYDLSLRVPTLLLTVAATFLVLFGVYPLSEKLTALAVVLWCPAVLHVVAVQTWNLASSLLPTRQGKRLFPVFAAIATLGAAGGGALVRLLLRWLSSIDLIAFAALLLGLAVVWFRYGVISLLAQRARELQREAERSQSRGTEASVNADDGDSEIVRGFRDIRETPLLARLALFVFLMQSVSVIIDYQFSGELKARLGQEAMASFLGSYYLVANVVVLGVTLFATARTVRWIGIGLALSLSAVVLAIGSATYWFAQLTGVLSGFWVVVGMAFAERVGQYAFTKSSVQMLVTPLDAQVGERAKTLIDGVIYRGATILVSIILLITAPSFEQLHWLAPPVVIACVVVVAVGVTIGPHYRSALFEALGAGRLDASLRRYLESGLGRNIVNEIVGRLQSDDPDQLVGALEFIRDLEADFERGRLLPLLAHPDPRVVSGTLEAMEARGMPPTHGELLGLLDRDRSPGVLRYALHLFGREPSPDAFDRIEQLVDHEDKSVASLASVVLARVAGSEQLADIEEEIRTGRRSQPGAGQVGRRVRGQTRAVDFARDLLAMLESEDLEMRLQAIDTIKQFQLREYLRPLIGALADPATQNAASEALERYGDAAVPELKEAAKSERNAPQRIQALRILGKLDGEAPLHALMEITEETAGEVRRHAVAALWRRSRQGRASSLNRAWVRARAVEEVHLVESYAKITALVPRESEPNRFFLNEVSLARADAEQRCFRLLGIYSDHDAMQRAYRHYRSYAGRTRSNAIELLDQHIDDPELDRFVALVEDESHGGSGLALADRRLAPDRERIRALIPRQDAWLAEIWDWLAGPTDPTTDEGWALDVTRVFSLKRLSMFAEINGAGLRDLARTLERRRVTTGEFVYKKGDPADSIYFVLSGTVGASGRGAPKLPYSPGDAFGEVSVLASAPYGFAVRSISEGQLGVIPKDRFVEALELYPAIVRATLKSFARRLRALNQARGEEETGPYAIADTARTTLTGRG